VNDIEFECLVHIGLERTVCGGAAGGVWRGTGAATEGEVEV